MFSLDNVKKLFSYNWVDIVKEIIPNGKKGELDKQSYQNLKNGSIIRIIAIIFAEVATIGIALYTVSKAYSWLYGDEIMKYAFKTVIQEGMTKWIIQIIKNAWFPILLLVYIRTMKEKEQNAWPYFITLLVTLFYTLVALHGAIGWLSAFPVSPLFTIAGIISLLLTFLGNVNIAIGCIDFCKQTKGLNNTAKQNNTFESYQPQQQNYVPQEQTMYAGQNVAPVQPTSSVEQSNYTSQGQSNVASMASPQQYRYCQHCGNQVNINSDTCFMCGNKL